MTFREEIDKRLKENKGESTELLVVNYKNLQFVVWSMAFSAFSVLQNRRTGAKYHLNVLLYIISLLLLEYCF